MTNIVDILGKVNQHSLLLLDELRLVQIPRTAMAILEDLRLRQVKTMATTLSELRHVLGQPLFKNAAWSWCKLS